MKGHAFCAYATNHLIDMDHPVTVDVEASHAIRQAEVGQARTMIDRAQALRSLSGTPGRRQRVWFG